MAYADNTPLIGQLNSQELSAYLDDIGKIRHSVKAYNLKAGDIACFMDEGDPDRTWYLWFYIQASNRDTEDGTKWHLSIQNVGGYHRDLLTEAWREYAILEQDETERTLNALAQRPVLTYDYITKA